MITVIDTLMESFSVINFDQNLLLVLAILIPGVAIFF